MKIPSLALTVFAALFAAAPTPVADTTVVWEADLDAPIEAVWNAFATKDGLETWLGGKVVEFDLALGAHWRVNPDLDAKAGDPGEIVYTVRSFEPLHMLSTQSKGATTAAAQGTDATWTVTWLEPRLMLRTHLRRVLCGVGQGKERDEAERVFRADNDRALARWKRAFAKVAFAPDVQPPAQSTGRTLIHEVEVDATPQEVWDAFTTKAGIEAWMVPLAEMDLRLDGTLKTNYDKTAGIGGAGTIVHHILSYEPGRMFSARFDVPEKAKALKLAEATWWTVTIAPAGDNKTRVRHTHQGFGEGPEWDTVYGFFDSGNQETMDWLVKHFAK